MAAHSPLLYLRVYLWLHIHPYYICEYTYGCTLTHISNVTFKNMLACQPVDKQNVEKIEHIKINSMETVPIFLLVSHYVKITF